MERTTELVWGWEGVSGAPDALAVRIEAVTRARVSVGILGAPQVARATAPDGGTYWWVLWCGSASQPDQLACWGPVVPGYDHIREAIHKMAPGHWQLDARAWDTRTPELEAVAMLTGKTLPQLVRQ